MAPRVSFILIAYRQERFVEAAVHSALAQDYPNLEVILSDDNSPDATFTLMERAAAGYRGPHEIRLTRTQGGRGTLAHLYHAFGRSSGDLIVVGAGDDLFYPQRVRRLVDEWQATGADALFSSYHRVDAEGGMLSPLPVLPRDDYDPSCFFAHGHARQIPGAAAAYDRRLLEAIRLPKTPVYAEDLFFSLMLGWRSRPVAVIEEPLLAYRVHNGALTAAGEDMLGVRGFERKSAQTAEMACGILRLFKQIVQTGHGVDPKYGTAAHVDMARLEAEIAFLDYRSRWLQLPFGQRLRAATRFRDRAQQRWLLPRLFGVNLLAAAKRG